MKKFFNWFLVGVFIVFGSMLVILMYYVPETIMKKPATLKDVVVVGFLFWVMTVSVVMLYGNNPKDKD
jgi:hypothetical protein